MMSSMNQLLFTYASIVESKINYFFFFSHPLPHSVSLTFPALCSDALSTNLGSQQIVCHQPTKLLCQYLPKKHAYDCYVMSCTVTCSTDKYDNHPKNFLLRN